MLNPFKNAAVQISLVNQKKQIDNLNTEIVTVDPEAIAKIATDVAVKTIVAVGLSIGALIVLKTVCAIVEDVTIAKLK